VRGHARRPLPPLKVKASPRLKVKATVPLTVKATIPLKVKASPGLQGNAFAPLRIVRDKVLAMGLGRLFERGERAARAREVGGRGGASVES